MCCTKKSIFEKIAPPSRHKPARIHVNLLGATTLYGKGKRKSISASTKLHNFLNTMNVKTTFYYPVHVEVPQSNLTKLKLQTKALGTTPGK